MPRRGDATRFKLQPADPFDLIRWLARTQSDPRKAIAELVQNSIDARATTITIERKRVKGAAALIVRDDGEGVLPAMGREEALRHLGTNIGHSHKLGLSPTERHARVIAGQYGVGLLGFWAIGKRMEIRSRVAGSEVHTLMLEEDRATARLGKMPVELDAPPTFTELVIGELHEAALRPTAGRRLADYLAAELRGPLLHSGVTLEVHDHLARGMAQKWFPVIPRRYEGTRLELPAEVAVEGYAPIRVELYLSRGAERPAIHLACAGTLVSEDIAEIDVLGFDRPPWIGRDVTGIIDFPSFQIPPGTRRGIVPNDAALAFARALEAIEPLLARELDELDRKRMIEADRHLVDDLRRALRGLRERMPHYDLPVVIDGAEVDANAMPGAKLGRKAAEVEPEVEAESEETEPQVTLFPPGPLAAVTIVPSAPRVTVGGERRVHARATDAEGRHLVTGVTFEWAITSALPSGVLRAPAAPGLAITSDAESFSVDGDGARPAIRVAGTALPGATATLRVVAREDALVATAEAQVLAIDERPERRGDAGIPKPELVDAPGASWRSRMAGATWQVNAGHEDYISLADGRARVRYLVSLLAKEIVQRTYSLPGGGEVLEHLVGVMAHAERNLR